MGTAFINALTFLVDIVFSIYLVVVMLRLILQLVKADFYNPFCQSLVKITNPALLPLRKFIPGYYGVDMASVVLLYILQLLKLFILVSLKVGFAGLSFYIFIAVIPQLIALLVQVYFYAILIRAIASWFHVKDSHPLYQLLFALTEPLLRPIRNKVPVTGMIDWSPFIAIIILMVFNVFFSSLFIW